MTTSPPNDRISRYLELSLPIMVAMTVLLSVLRISGYGYLPGDDALRHAAFAIDSRVWGDVVVLSNEIRPDVDVHPGWHAILRFLHQRAGLGADALVTFSYIFTFTLFGAAGLLGSRKPAAWAVALALIAAVLWEMLGRQLLGRPFSISISGTLLLLFLWNTAQDKPSWKLIVLTSLILGLAIWVHSTAWYLWIMVLACIWLGNGAKAGRAFLASFAIGLLLACVLNGGCYNIIIYPIKHLWLSLAQDPLIVTSLAIEFRPNRFPLQACGLVALILISRQLTGVSRNDRLFQPDFLLYILGCILGLYVSRFWTDWGAAALAVWICRQTVLLLEHLHLNRLRLWMLTAGACSVVFLTVSANIDGRYSGTQRSVLLTLPKDRLLPLMPTDRGVLYGNSMHFFYQLYWRFPETKWRYLLGFEPAMMPPDELRAFRIAQYNNGNFDPVYKSWAKQMTDDDRLMMYSDGEPNYPDMSFEAIGNQIWIGKVCRKLP